MKKNNKLKCQIGGPVSTTGYLPESPDRFNPYNTIPSNLITMDTVPHDILAIPDNGQPKLMKKNSGLHKFIGANQVTEIPMAQDGLQFYTGGRQATPTGQSNAFSNNAYGLTPELVQQIAQRNKFRTDNNINFQTDLENFINSNSPNVMNDVWGKFGKTKQGQFADGMMGARTMYALAQLNKTQNVPQPSQPIPVISSPIDPLAGFRGEPIYDANQHLIALSEYKGGDAAKANARMVFVDKMGKPDMNRGMYSIPGTEWSNKYTKGVKRLFTEEGLDQYRVPGIMASNKDGGLVKAQLGDFIGQNPNQNLWNTDFNTGIKFPGAPGIKVDQAPGTPTNPYQGIAIEQGKKPGEWVGKKKNSYEPNVMGAAMLTGAMGMFANELERVPDYKVYDQQVERGTSDAQFATVNPVLRRGFIDQNSGRSAPNLQTYTQYANQKSPNFYGQGDFIPFAQDGMSMGPGMLPDIIAPPIMMGPETMPAQSFAPVSSTSFTSSSTPAVTPSIQEDTAEGYEQIKKFIKKQEGFAKKAKWDYKQYTNGYGTKAKYAGEELTRDEAEARLDKELLPTIEKVKSKIQVPINNSQLTAITSMAYNGGYGVVRKIINQINKGADTNTVANLIKTTATTVNNGAMVLDGLVKRRKQEAGLFMQQYKEGGEYDLSPEQIKGLQDAGYEIEFS